MWQIVDETYLLTVLLLSPHFIARHARAMGAFARKPRRFFLHRVLAHLEYLADEAQSRSRRKKQHDHYDLRRIAGKALRDRRSKEVNTPIDFYEYYKSGGRTG